MKVKPICYGFYTEADRGFRRCYVCKLQYRCKRKSGIKKGDKTKENVEQ